MEKQNIMSQNGFYCSAENYCTSKINFWKVFALLIILQAKTVNFITHLFLIKMNHFEIKAFNVCIVANIYKITQTKSSAFSVFLMVHITTVLTGKAWQVGGEQS